MNIVLTREEAQQVLDALSDCREDSEELFYDYKQKYGEHYKPQRITFQQSVLDQSAQAIETLRARLAQPEPEPVAWRTRRNDTWSYHHNEPHGVPHEPLYAAPRQREWQGLTDDEIHGALYDSGAPDGLIDFARAIEAKLKEKNSGG